MPLWPKSRDSEFAEIIEAQAENLRQAGQFLQACISNENPDNLIKIASQMESLESVADRRTHDMISLIINSKYFPPCGFDWQDIHRLAEETDTVFDIIDEVIVLWAQYVRFKNFQLKEEFETLASVAQNAILGVADLLAMLPYCSGRKNSDKRKKMKEIIIKINDFENQGDDEWRRIKENILRENGGENITWRQMARLEIAERLEDTIDECEDVSIRVAEILAKGE